MEDEECLKATHYYYEDNKFVNVGVHGRDNKLWEYGNVGNKNCSSNQLFVLQFCNRWVLVFIRNADVVVAS